MGEREKGVRWCVRWALSAWSHGAPNRSPIFMLRIRCPELSPLLLFRPITRHSHRPRVSHACAPHHPPEECLARRDICRSEVRRGRQCVPAAHSSVDMADSAEAVIKDFMSPEDLAEMNAGSAPLFEELQPTIVGGGDLAEMVRRPGASGGLSLSSMPFKQGPDFHASVRSTDLKLRRLR